MIDKVQKIKEWISKEQEGLMDAQGNFEYPEHEGAYHILCNLDTYIDSMQEEPVNEELEEASEKYAYELFPSIGVANTEIELAFKAGAQWQKKKTINKACAWLEENYDSGRYMPNDAGEYRGKEGFIKDFVNDLGKGE